MANVFSEIWNFLFEEEKKPKIKTVNREIQNNLIPDFVEQEVAIPKTKSVSKTLKSIVSEKVVYYCFRVHVSETHANGGGYGFGDDYSFTFKRYSNEKYVDRTISAMEFISQKTNIPLEHNRIRVEDYYELTETQYNNHVYNSKKPEYKDKMFILS